MKVYNYEGFDFSYDEQTVTTEPLCIGATLITGNLGIRGFLENTTGVWNATPEYYDCATITEYELYLGWEWDDPDDKPEWVDAWREYDIVRHWVFLDDDGEIVIETRKD